jgi:hypothetical protein
MSGPDDDSLPCTQVARDLTVNQGAGGSTPPAAANERELSSDDSPPERPWYLPPPDDETLRMWRLNAWTDQAVVAKSRVVAETARSCQCIRFAELVEGSPEQVIVCAACALAGKLAVFE